MANTPAYLLASDIHTSLNNPTQEQGFLDSAIDLVSKGIPATLIAAGNEILNMPAEIGNLVTGSKDFSVTTNKQAIADIDSDLAKYYDGHQLGIDTMGFIVGSFAPGLGGVKALRAGQTVVKEAVAAGRFGELTGNALGLIAPNREKYLSQAISQIGQSGNLFKLTEANTAKAMAAGTWQQVLEGAVFTGVANAAMNQSPILDDRSAKDLMWDVVIGGGLGGAIGGSILGIQSFTQIRKAATAAAAEVRPWTITSAPVESATASDKILFKLQQIEAMPGIDPTHPLVSRIDKTATATYNKLWDEIRGHAYELADNDSVVGDALLRSIKDNTFDGNVQNFLEAARIGRVTTVTAAEKEINKAMEAVKLNLNVTPEQRDALLRYKVAFVNNWDTTASVTPDRPKILNLMDKMKPGEKIELAEKGDGIYAGRKFYPMENNPYRPFNIYGLTHNQVEARYYWAEMQAKWVDDGSHIVHDSDIPLLQKAVRDGVSKLKVIPEGKAIDEAVTLNSVAEIADFTKTRQAEIAARMLSNKSIPMSTDDIVDKLKGYFGINFNTISDPAGGYYGFFHRILGKSGNKDIAADVIAMEKGGLTRPLAELIRTLKHEEGHSMFQALLDSRGVNRTNLDATWPALKEEVTKLSKLARPALWKDPTQQAYRENWHELFADSFYWLSRRPEQLERYPEFNKFAGHLVRPIPQKVLDDIATRVIRPSKAEISKIVNAKEEVLFGGMDHEPSWNLRQSVVDTAAAAGRLTNPLFEPTYLKVITKSNLYRNADGHLLEGMAVIAQKEKLYKEAADRVVSSSLYRLVSTAAGVSTRLPDASGMQGKAIGMQAGPGAFTNEAGNYGSWSSFFSNVGKTTHNMMKAVRESTAELFNPTLQKLAVNTNEAVEWSVLNERLRGLPNNYFAEIDELSGQVRLMFGKTPVIDDFVDEAAFNKAMEKLALAREEAAKEGMPVAIEIKSANVQKLVLDHIDTNNTRRGILRQVHANNGYQDRFQEGVFYPIPRNPKDTPHFAFVIDPTVQGRGHSQMIYAKDAYTLELMRNELIGDPELARRGLKVLTNSESEQYYKSIGKFEFERTLSDNYINTALARKGKSQSFIPVTDPKRIVEDFIDWHHSRDNSLVRTLVEHKYSPEFAQFRVASESAVDATKSRFGYLSPQAFAEATVDNPGSNLIKMALDISKVDEYPLWTPLNTFLDGAYSRLMTNISKVWNTATHVDQTSAINTALREAGYTDVISAEALAAANEKVPRGMLTTLVNKANAILATFALRADPFNALNNAVGSSVLLGSELKAVLRSIESGNKEAVGELANLAHIRTPGTGDAVFSPTKLIANRIAKFHTDVAGREWFKKNGFISSISDQYDQTLDHIAIALAKGDSARMQQAFESAKAFGNAAEKYTGNKLAEEFNRYVAAGVMKDITDIAVKHGYLTEDTALSYINTFVNRTQGNYLASQRPVIFQGPLGQAMGLFQTYQFNMLQQVFRHIGEGHWKNVATMMGLQGGVYGMNGLPAFNAINTHIIGQAGGNQEHKTLYDSIFSLGGKEAGEWLLYGGLSNGLGLFHPDLKTNIYSRGDINPRHVTLVPVNPAEVPIYQATARLLSNVKEGYQKVDMGADLWSTFLRGIEQNGVSRPLAGMAQILEGAGRTDKKVISTNQQGNMLMAHDLYSLSSLMRVAGAKPLDEAIVNDTMFRINTYRTADAAKRKVLGEAIKLSILGGDVPDEEQINEFAKSFAKTGGKQSEFAQFMAHQYTNASVSQAEQLRQKIGNSYSKSVQLIMNGGE